MIESMFLQNGISFHFISRLLLALVVNSFLPLFANGLEKPEIKSHNKDHKQMTTFELRTKMAESFCLSDAAKNLQAYLKAEYKSWVSKMSPESFEEHIKSQNKHMEGVWEVIHKHWQRPEEIKTYMIALDNETEQKVLVESIQTRCEKRLHNIEYNKDSDILQMILGIHRYFQKYVNN